MTTADLDHHPKVLILLAARNGSAWIEEQITTILAQRAVRVDLVISNDHSTDDTNDKLSRFAGDPRVRVVAPPASTGSAAQSFLWLIKHAPLADHQYVALADQDDIWLPDKIHRGAFLLKKSGAAGYSCAVRAFWPGGRQRTLRQGSRITQSDFFFEGAGQGCTFVMTSAFFEKVRAFLSAQPDCYSAVHYHDWMLYALARSWCRTWYFDAEPMMQYRQHAANDTGARLSLSGVKKRISLVKSGWYKVQLQAMSSLVACAAPLDPLNAEWNTLLNSPDGLAHRLKVSGFCMRGGRRRRSDRMILVFSALLGWI